MTFYDLAWPFRSGNLDPKAQELIILRMATLHHSAYELSQNMSAAKLARLIDQEIARNTAGTPSGLDRRGPRR